MIIGFQDLFDVQVGCFSPKLPVRLDHQVALAGASLSGEEKIEGVPLYDLLRADLQLDPDEGGVYKVTVISNASARAS